MDHRASAKVVQVCRCTAPSISPLASSYERTIVGYLRIPDFRRVGEVELEDLDTAQGKERRFFMLKLSGCLM